MRKYIYAVLIVVFFSFILCLIMQPEFIYENKTSYDQGSLSVMEKGEVKSGDQQIKIENDVVVNQDESSWSEFEGQTAALVDQAVICYKKVEEIKNEYDQNSNAYKLVNNLQKMIFEDDVRFAYHCSGGIDENAKDQLLEIYNNNDVDTIVSKLNIGTNNTSKLARTSRINENDSRADYVEKLRTDINPVTEELVPLFNLFDELKIKLDHQVELFKDVSTYLALRTGSIDRFQSLTEDLGEIPQFLVAHEEELDAITKIYSYRLESYHQIESGDFLQKVNDIAIRRLGVDNLRKYE